MSEVETKHSPLVSHCLNLSEIIFLALTAGCHLQNLETFQVLTISTPVRVKNPKAVHETLAEEFCMLICLSH